ncbi:MAG TPA: hypothetical protein VF113_11490 [Stellaceae bacterium]
MFTLSRLPSFARVATLSVALAVPAMGLTGAAYADDEYGTNRSPTILQSAQSAPSFADAFALATGQTQRQAIAKNAAAPVASDVTVPTIEQDLVGAGGQQDSVARDIYHPGSGTDW